MIALLTAVLSSVLVLPSLLILWERHGPESVTMADATNAVPGD